MNVWRIMSKYLCQMPVLMYNYILLYQKRLVSDTPTCVCTPSITSVSRKFLYVEIKYLLCCTRIAGLCVLLTP